jgi:hypothetical protein
MQSHITFLLSELDVELGKIDFNKTGHVTLSVKGEDSEFVANLLTQEFGICNTINTLEGESVVTGQLVDVGKVGYGLYVDIGLPPPPRIDALLPLHCLRKQLNMDGVPLRKLAKTLVLVDNLPLEIRVVNIDRSNVKVEAELSKTTTSRIEDWIADDHERLILLGTTRDMIERALAKSSHSEDIYEFEELGTFEYSLRCKRSTRASGIVAAIGPLMKGVPIHLFIPTEIKVSLNDKA